ncbi:hypothetical protein EVAR_91314_1 [Eumeta japonica]|uniref:Uncharacterized protein n=1 Tax=Eumeta variegata TaxID=151549 RepID=A0A4C1SVF0_EUMVA|nr:hypothetical protein EVAR_91314_1 [Eumeta japonica]
MIFYGYMVIRLCLYRGDDKLDHRLSRAADMSCPNAATVEHTAPAVEGVDKAVSDTLEDSQSDQSLIGGFLDKLDIVDDNDEDVLLESDPENTTTIHHDPDIANR